MDWTLDLDQDSDQDLDLDLGPDLELDNKMELLLVSSSFVKRLKV